MVLVLLLFKQPNHCPGLAQLLIDSYNLHVRYRAAMALDIAFTGTGSKDTLALTEAMRDDPINYVRQVALTSMLDSIQRLKLMVPADYIPEAPDVSLSVLTPDHVETHWSQMSERWRDVYLSSDDRICGCILGALEAGTIFSMKPEASPNILGHLSMMPRIATSSLIALTSGLTMGPCLANDASAAPEDVPDDSAPVEATSNSSVSPKKLPDFPRRRRIPRSPV